MEKTHTSFVGFRTGANDIQSKETRKVLTMTIGFDNDKQQGSIWTRELVVITGNTRHVYEPFQGKLKKKKKKE